MPIFIQGTGSYLPPRVLHNRDLEKILDTNDEWITQRTGIRERRVAEPEVAASDLALEASRNALEMAGMKVADLQLIIVATITPDTHCPAASNWLQAKLGADRAVTFDVTAACSGFVFALNVAEQYLKAGTFQTISGCGLGDHDPDLELEGPDLGHPLGRRGRRSGPDRESRRAGPSAPLHPHSHRRGQRGQPAHAGRRLQDHTHIP